MLIWRVFGWLRHIVERDPAEKGFVVVKQRGVPGAGPGPERTYAWFGGYRRLSKDYEGAPSVSEAMVQLSANRLMAR